MERKRRREKRSEFALGKCQGECKKVKFFGRGCGGGAKPPHPTGILKVVYFQNFWGVRAILCGKNHMFCIMERKGAKRASLETERRERSRSRHHTNVS